MASYQRNFREGNIVKITTTRDEEFIGTLLSMYYIITENNTFSVEIYIKQHKKHQGNDFGTVGFPMSYIKTIEAC